MKKNITSREDVKMVLNHLIKLHSQVPKTKDVLKILEHRRFLVENYGSVDGKHPQIPSSAKVTKVKADGVSCEWVCDENSDPDKRLLYLHGGAFIAGSLNSHRALSAELSKRAGVSVLAVDYRRAPENPFPAGLEDCYKAYLWMLYNSPSGNSEAKNTFIAGDSAGGNLAISTTLKIKESKAKLPSAVLAISPSLDLSGKSISLNELDGYDPILNKKAFKLLPLVYLFGKDLLKINESLLNKVSFLSKLLISKQRLLINPFVSPIYANLEGFPPVLINVGDIEILRDDSIRFVDKARRAGSEAYVKVWPNMFHVFIAFLGYIPEAEECINEMADFMKKYSS